MDEVMDYEPRVGVDFMYDYYEIIHTDRGADLATIEDAIISALSEYHPDRVARAAREFQTRAEHMVRVIGDAKIILTNEASRSEYDEILAAWEGPVSRDGTPILSIGAAMRAVMSRKGAEEVEAVFIESEERIAAALRVNPRRRALHTRLLAAAEASGSPDADELRAVLEEELLIEESVLAVAETDRSKLLGLPVDESHHLAIGHAGSVAEAIDGARTRVTEEHRRRVLGSVSTRLAILSGRSVEDAGGPGTELDTLTGALPDYFEAQAKQVGEIARLREEILLERLRIIEPEYPIPEVQTELHTNFVVGYIGTNQETKAEVATWIAFSYDPAEKRITNFELPEDIEDPLERRDFESVYLSGYNILTFPVTPHIDWRALLSEVVNKHIALYHTEQDDQLKLF